MEDYDEEDFTIVGMAEDIVNDDLDIIPMNNKKDKDNTIEELESNEEFTISGNVFEEDGGSKKQDTEETIQDDEILEELNRYKKANNLRLEQYKSKINKYYARRKFYLKRKIMAAFLAVTVVVIIILSSIIS